MCNRQIISLSLYSSLASSDPFSDQRHISTPLGIHPSYVHNAEREINPTPYLECRTWNEAPLVSNYIPRWRSYLFLISISQQQQQSKQWQPRNLPMRWNETSAGSKHHAGQMMPVTENKIYSMDENPSRNIYLSGNN